MRMFFAFALLLRARTQQHAMPRIRFLIFLPMLSCCRHAAMITTRCRRCLRHAAGAIERRHAPRFSLLMPIR